jgi:hypothetical protein
MTAVRQNVRYCTHVIKLILLQLYNKTFDISSGISHVWQNSFTSATYIRNYTLLGLICVVLIEIWRQMKI